MIKYLTNKISIALRTRLVTHIHELYLTGNTFYSVINLDRCSLALVAVAVLCCAMI